jgi:hypothetical protein
MLDSASVRCSLCVHGHTLKRGPERSSLQPRPSVTHRQLPRQRPAYSLDQVCATPSEAAYSSCRTCSQNTEPLCSEAEEVRRTSPGVSINVIDMAGYTQQLECVAAGTGRLWHVGAGADLRGLVRQAQTYVDPTSCPRSGG